MMERFDLSYRITDDAKAASLVVERLPWESPSYQEQWAAAINYLARARFGCSIS